MRVYVLWTPRGADARPIGSRIMQSLARILDESGNARGGVGFRVPVHHRHAPWRSGSSAPRPIDFSAAHSNIVIAIYDDLMAIREDWSAYLKDICTAAGARGNADLLIPVLFTSDHSTPPAWGRVQGIHPPQIDEPDGIESATAIRRIVIGLISRMLDKARGRADIGSGEGGPSTVRIFLSHAKRDGKDAALLIEELGRLKPDKKVAGVEMFFDAADTLAGSRYDDQFRKAIQESVFLAIVTDAYHSRPWCQWELLLAKQYQRPILIWDLVEEGTARSFPYLGNVPVVRTTVAAAANLDEQEKIAAVVQDQPVIERLLLQLLVEALRAEVWEQHARRRIAARPGLVGKQVAIFSRPPELADIVYQCPREEKKVIIYPDPPISQHECSLLAVAHPDLTLFSLSELIG